MRATAAFFIIFAMMVLDVMPVNSAHATSGTGCLRVVNIESGDMLNIRRRPHASARIVATVDPATQGILHLDGTCRPKSLPWRSRWCPVSYYSGGPNDPAKGWVKARFVRDSDCP